MTQKPPATTVASSDGLGNVASGLGSHKSKRMGNRFGIDHSGYAELDAAYTTDWITARIVDAPIEDMCREWRTISMEDAEAVQQAEARYAVKSAVQEALRWARLYGGAGLVMMTDQDLSQPLDVEKLKEDSLKKIAVFDRYELAGTDINYADMLADNFLQPTYYTIGGGSTRIHWSHVVRFEGAKLPRRQSMATGGWGGSEVVRLLQDIKDYKAAVAGIAELMEEANVDVITRQGLADELATDQEGAITSRYATFSAMKSNVNLALLDGEESYDRRTLSLSGVSDAIKLLQVNLSGAANIPHTRLFGDSASGLNSTGAGERKNYDDIIRSLQQSRLERQLRQIDEVLIRSTLGSMPDDYDFTFNPLSVEDREAEARTTKIIQERDLGYLDAGIITADQVRQNLQSSETYQFGEEYVSAGGQSNKELF